MLIGVTGSFGSGKTTVAKMFEKLGAYVIDADKVCHSLMAPSKKVYEKMIENFGDIILRKNKSIDRSKVSEIVFNDKKKLQLLNRIVHPEAIREISRIIQVKKNKKVIVVDAALLIETGFYKKMDKVILVESKRTLKVNRQALKILRIQLPVKKKLLLSDFIIDNSFSKKKTTIQVEKIWKQLGVCYACK